jgi:hypothetical protein
MLTRIDEEYSKKLFDWIFKLTTVIVEEHRTEEEDSRLYVAVNFYSRDGDQDTSIWRHPATLYEAEGYNTYGTVCADVDFTLRGVPYHMIAGPIYWDLQIITADGAQRLEGQWIRIGWNSWTTESPSERSKPSRRFTPEASDGRILR